MPFQAGDMADDVFISYSREERDVVRVIARSLRGLGLTVWFDERLTVGDSFGDEIECKIAASKAVVVCWSPRAKKSEWVKAETDLGKGKLATCQVAGPDDFVPPPPYNILHTVDLRAWLANARENYADWMKLVLRVGELCGRRDLQEWAALWPKPAPADVRRWLSLYADSPLAVVARDWLRDEEDKLERARLHAIEETQREQARVAEKSRRALEARERLRAEKEAREKQRAEARAARIAPAEDDWTAPEGLIGSGVAGAVAGPSVQVHWGAVGAIAVMALATAVLALNQAANQALWQPLSQAEAPMRQLEHVAFTQPRPEHEARRLELARGETLSGVLLRAGADRDQIAQAVAAISKVMDPATMRPGMNVDVSFSGTSLSGVAFRNQPGSFLVANRARDGKFFAREVLAPLVFEVTRVAAPVEQSLYDTLTRGGASEKEVRLFYDVFGGEVLNWKVHPGDHVEIVFERFRDEADYTVKTGDALYVALNQSGYYRFKGAAQPRADWYDPQGLNLARSGSLAGADMIAFKDERSRIDALRVASQREG